MDGKRASRGSRVHMSGPSEQKDGSFIYRGTFKGDFGDVSVHGRCVYDEASGKYMLKSAIVHMPGGDHFLDSTEAQECGSEESAGTEG